MKKVLLFTVLAAGLVGHGSPDFGKINFAELPSQHSQGGEYLADLPSQHSQSSMYFADLPSQHSQGGTSVADLPSQQGQAIT